MSPFSFRSKFTLLQPLDISELVIVVIRLAIRFIN